MVLKGVVCFFANLLAGNLKIVIGAAVVIAVCILVLKAIELGVAVIIIIIEHGKFM